MHGALRKFQLYRHWDGSSPVHDILRLVLSAPTMGASIFERCSARRRTRFRSRHPLTVQQHSAKNPGAGLSMQGEEPQSIEARATAPTDGADPMQAHSGNVDGMTFCGGAADPERFLIPLPGRRKKVRRRMAGRGFQLQPQNAKHLRAGRGAPGNGERGRKPPAPSESLRIRIPRSLSAPRQTRKQP